MTDRKGNILVIFLAAGLVLSLATAGYFFLQTQSLVSTRDKQLQKESSTQNQESSNTNTAFPQAKTQDKTANWKTYSDNTIIFNYPADWNVQPAQIGGMSSTVEITDPANIYTFSFREEANYNQETGQPYKDIYEFLKFPYKLPTVKVSGFDAVQTLPRAGREGDFQITLLNGAFYILELDTPRDGSKTEEGKKLFDQILSTFKFL